MVNLETHVLSRLNREVRRDLPQHVYPKGKRGHLYFVASGVCQRMHHELGSAEFAEQYAGLLSGVQRPQRKARVTTPHVRRTLPPAPILWRLFDYQPSSGLLFHREREDWMFDDFGRSSPTVQARVWNAKNAGRRACRVGSNPRYLSVSIDGKPTLAHRAIWKMLRGKEPEIVDHINGNGHDNRIENLRSVSLAENSRNKVRKRGKLTGIYRRRNNWTVKIGTKHGGVFACLGQAIKARTIGERLMGFMDR